MLDMDQITLAAQANISRNTVVDFEKGKRTPNTNNLTAIKAAFEVAGVIFLAAGEMADGGPGVRLAAPSGSPAP